MTRAPMRRGTIRVGEAARRRIFAGGVQAKGRPSLSKRGYAELGRMIVVERAHGRCEACGEARALIHLEHAVPRSQGGADSWGNCWGTCTRCHRKKEAPYASGRLRVRPGGDGMFTFDLVTGSKLDQVVLSTWVGGRVAMPEEAARLAELR